MNLWRKKYDRDRRRIPVLPGELVEVDETDLFVADAPLIVQWRERTTDGEGKPMGEEPTWNGPYAVAAGKDLGDDPVGFSKRRVEPGGQHALEVRLSSLTGAQPFTFLVRPEEKHLTEDEVRRMAVDLSGATLMEALWDPSVSGLKGIPREREAWEESPMGKRETPASPLARALYFAWLWAEIAAAYARCLPRLPTRPVTQYRLGRPHEGSQNPRTVRRNLSEGRINGDGQVLRDRIHLAVRTRDLDTPTAAALVENARELNALREHFQEAVSAVVAQQRAVVTEQKSYGQQNNRVSGTAEMRILHLEKILAELGGQQALEIPVELQRLRSTPSRHTALAMHDFDHRAWYDLVDQVRALLDSRVTLIRDRRLEGSARRRTWQLYEYWVVFKVYEHLTQRLRFGPVEGQTWQDLEEREDGNFYALRENACLVLEHSSGLRVRFQVQPNFPDPEGSYITPDLVLSLEGETYDYHLVPAPLRPLVIDAKMQDLEPGRSRSRREKKLHRTLEWSSERYQRVLRTHFPGKPMAYLAHAGGKEASGNAARFRAWPVREPTPMNAHHPDDTAGLPGGLKAEHLAYHNGVLLVRPTAMGNTSKEGRFGDTDIHRVVTAWLALNRIFWVCCQCGCDLSDQPQSELAALVQQAHEAREDHIVDGKSRAAPKLAPVGTDRQGQNVTRREIGLMNRHLVCPDEACGNIVVISRCEHGCLDEGKFVGVIFKQFGTLSQQSKSVTPIQLASWHHEEIAHQGQRPGTGALWSRPCPRCGREKHARN